MPLSQSLYVSGRLTNTNTVLVDIGTGYFVEKSLVEAKQFLDKKVSYVQGNADELDKIIYVSQRNLETVALVKKSIYLIDIEGKNGTRGKREATRKSIIDSGL